MRSLAICMALLALSACASEPKLTTVRAYAPQTGRIQGETALVKLTDGTRVRTSGT